MQQTKKGIISLLLFLSFLPFHIFSAGLESNSKTADILSQFENRFQLMDSLIFKYNVMESTPAFIDASLFEVAEPARIEPIDKAVEAQISAMKNVTGLDLRGQVYVRPGNSISYDPDDPLVAYNAKIQAELEWNIFHSSIYKRASKVKELILKGELRQLDYARKDLDEAILIQKQQTRYNYYSRLLSVINIHAENVRLLMETQIYLLEQGKLSGDELLRLINQHTELERQLVSIKADSVISAIPAPNSVAYIELTDTAGMFESIRSNNIELKRLDLQSDLLATQRHNTDYVQTMNILPFVRYSYYNRENVHNTYNLDVGVSFKIPVSAEVKKKRKALSAEIDVIDFERRLLETESLKGVALSFHDLEIYNENIKGEFLRMKNLKEFLDGRTHSYSNVDGEYSRIERLVEYNSYLESWERLLDYVYHRDLVLIDLQKYLLTEPISNYIKFKELN